MLRHFHGLYCHRPKLSTNQRARIRSVIVKFAVVHPLDNKVRDFSFLKTGFSSYIRDPADKMRFFQVYTDITGLGKKMVTDLLRVFHSCNTMCPNYGFWYVCDLCFCTISQIFSPFIELLNF